VCSVASGINPAGAITGSYLLADFSANPGFVRASNGTFTSFNPPGSTGTQPTAINPAEAITGSYFDASFAGHGFLRSP
jgi:hypothetical protein